MRQQMKRTSVYELIGARAVINRIAGFRGGNTIVATVEGRSSIWTRDARVKYIQSAIGIRVETFLGAGKLAVGQSRLPNHSDIVRIIDSSCYHSSRNRVSLTVFLFAARAVGISISRFSSVLLAGCIVKGKGIDSRNTINAESPFSEKTDIVGPEVNRQKDGAFIVRIVFLNRNRTRKCQLLRNNTDDDRKGCCE